MTIARPNSWQRYGPDWRALREQVFAAKGRQCVYCGRPAATVDHLTPRILGGPHTLANLAPACARCNYSRGARLGNRLRATHMRPRPRITPAAQQPWLPSRDW